MVRAALAVLLLCAAGPAAAASRTPALDVVPVMEGLRGVWDLAFAPDGALLVTEKCHGLSVRLPDGSVRRLFGSRPGYALQAPDLFCEYHSGMLGVAVDPQFDRGRRHVYVYAASSLSGTPRSNRVIRLRVSRDWSRVDGRRDIVADIAFKDLQPFGRRGAHSGGRLRFGPDGYLWITTGDNHDPDLPQDPRRLGGKVLRVDWRGRAAPGNRAPPGFDPRIYTYGHRNPQGLAFRPGSGQAYSSEHGPNHSDEVTPLRAGGNAGWDPRRRPGLDCPEGYCGYAGDVHSMPMTDTARFPAALRPAWDNGGRSQGMGPLVFLEGAQWAAWHGGLAVGFMRWTRIDLLVLDDAGQVATATTLDLPKHRWRSLVQGPDGALWAATDEGLVLRIVPR